MRGHGVALARALALTLALGVTGCATFVRTEGQGVTISDGGIEVDGVANEATGAKVEAGRFPTPAGDFVVLTYPSKAGPCYDLVSPNGERTAGCLTSSGVDPDQPVAGGHPAPEFSYAINPSAFNYGFMTGTDIGMVHHGVAHPVVAEVRLMAKDGSLDVPLVFKPVKAPNVKDFHVFIAYAPSQTTSYELAAYDAGGCLLAAIPAGVDGMSEEPRLHGRAAC